MVIWLVRGIECILLSKIYVELEVMLLLNKLTRGDSRNKVFKNIEETFYEESMTVQ